MLFAADIGNSSISFGVFDDGGRLLLKSKVEAVKARSADEYAVLFRDILSLYRFDSANISGGIVCSVVSPLTGTVCAAIGRLFGIRPMEVGPGVKTGLNIKIDLQAQLGADIVANAVAAAALAEPPLVIVDFGTATTFTVINRQGVLEGVVICPGVRVSLDALAQSGAELPDVSVAPPRRLIGKNTQDSMRAGVLYGHAAMTDGLIDRIRGGLGERQLGVLATGGLADAVLPYCREQAEHRPDLTLEGLQLLWLKNRK